MKKEVSARDKKMMALIFRWRWALTFGAALNACDLMYHYRVRDVTGWPLLPSAWVLPWLTFGCVGTCVFVAAMWVACLYKPRLNG